MAQDRNQELSSRSDSNLVSERGHEFDYGSLKERKLAEERRYRNHDYNDRRPTWRDGKPSVSFKEDQDRPSPKVCYATCSTSEHNLLCHWSTLYMNLRIKAQCKNLWCYMKVCLCMLTYKAGSTVFVLKLT